MAHVIERERERERESVCVCVCEREREREREKARIFRSVIDDSGLFAPDDVQNDMHYAHAPLKLTMPK